MRAPWWYARNRSSLASRLLPLVRVRDMLSSQQGEANTGERMIGARAVLPTHDGVLALCDFDD